MDWGSSVNMLKVLLADDEPYDIESVTNSNQAMAAGKGANSQASQTLTSILAPLYGVTDLSNAFVPTAGIPSSNAAIVCAS